MSVESTGHGRAGHLRPPFRIEYLGLFFLAVVALVVVVFADQAAWGSSADGSEGRFRLATTASGNVTLFMLAVLVALGYVLSRPTSARAFRLSQQLVPWHTRLWIFVAAFGLAHVASVLFDPFPRISILGVLVPGLSGYRTLAAALGTTAIYAFVVTFLTARYASRLPPGRWLTIHRVSVITFVLAWLHVRLISSETSGYEWLYAGTALAVGASAAYRVWASRRALPSYAGWVREAPVAGAVER